MAVQSYAWTRTRNIIAPRTTVLETGTRWVSKSGFCVQKLVLDASPNGIRICIVSSVILLFDWAVWQLAGSNNGGALARQALISHQPTTNLSTQVVLRFTMAQ
jgi:hypothetical protein